MGIIRYLLNLRTKRKMLHRHAVEDECPYCGRQTPMFNLRDSDGKRKYANSCLWCGKRIDLKHQDGKWILNHEAENMGVVPSLVEPISWNPSTLVCRMQYIEEVQKND